jgi:hypothetical protein
MVAYSLVSGGSGGDGALRAAIARVGAADDGDLLWIGRSGSLWDGVRRGEKGKEESSDFGVHLDGDEAEALGEDGNC